MGKEELEIILENQKRFFKSGITLDIGYRLEQLKKLRSLILLYEASLVRAMSEDFSKPEFEVLGSESRFVLAELNLLIRNLRRWAGPQHFHTSIVNFIARSHTVAQPYGQVLVLSPWNYPFQLSMIPVMSAIAAGNCVILKVSQKVPRTGEVIAEILSHFPGELVTMVSGEHSLTDYLLNYKFDYIFFTGSTGVGRKVMAKAAVTLCPVTLELGGKNPCVVTSDARLELAARRIVSGKFLNAGQTCIAPDYLLIDEKVKERFIQLFKREIKSFYGDDPYQSNDYCRMISSEKASRMVELIKQGQIVTGGSANVATCYIEPTIIEGMTLEDSVMKEEIFGPVLPLIAYNNINEIFEIIDRNPKSLAAYIFTTSRKTVRKFMAGSQSGSIAVNDTVMQVASPRLPFGGIGPSGIGRYHGQKSFETFSNIRSVMIKSNLTDIPLRYPPYTALKKRLLKILMR